jgi:hypothetical protein
MPPWNPPAPERLPEWRATMVGYSMQRSYMQTLSQAVNVGRTNVFPVVPGMLHDYSPGSVAAQFLAPLETRRLANAELFSVDADMTALALACSEQPHQGEIIWREGIPDTGLIVFDEPIGGYRMNFRDVIRGTMADYDGVDAWVTTPIVAASWSRFSAADAIAIPDAPPSQQPVWMHNNGQELTRVPLHFKGIWMNFYTCTEDRYALLPDDTVVGLGPDGLPMTAARMREVTVSTEVTPLSWDNETLVPFGIEWPKPLKDSTDEWLSVVYTTWQLMTQKGNICEVEEMPRNRHGRKRDAKEGIGGSGGVRRVRVHPRRRPTRVQREDDAATSTGRREPHYKCRFPVGGYRQNKCMATHLHNTVPPQCWHDKDHIVLPHIKGPEGAPLRITERVNRFDRMPD